MFFPWNNVLYFSLKSLVVFDSIHFYVSETVMIVFRVYTCLNCRVINYVSFNVKAWCCVL
jgi:hypothetical protein